jgi:hypothetical protein
MPDRILVLEDLVICLISLPTPGGPGMEEEFS